MSKSTKQVKAAEPSTSFKALDADTLNKVFSGSQPFKAFVLASGVEWPVQTSNPLFKPLQDAFSAARKAFVQDGPRNVNKTVEPVKPAKKAASLKPSKATKADKPSKVTKPAEPEVPEDVLLKLKADAHAQVAALTVRPCGCGCGTETKSSFLPGHDARLFSRLVAEAKAAYLAKGKRAA